MSILQGHIHLSMTIQADRADRLLGTSGTSVSICRHRFIWFVSHRQYRLSSSMFDSVKSAQGQAVRLTTLNGLLTIIFSLFLSSSQPTNPSVDNTSYILLPAIWSEKKSHKFLSLLLQPNKEHAEQFVPMYADNTLLWPCLGVDVVCLCTNIKMDERSLKGMPKYLD